MELLFVYNANTDPVSVVTDYLHKVFSPATYKCELCSLTHHNLGARKKWKDFKRKTNVHMSFYYIRQFESTFPDQYEYPVVLIKRNGANSVFLSKEDLVNLGSIDDLIDILESQIENAK